MATEIVQSVNIISDGLGKLPSVWEDKPNVIGLNTSILQSLQTSLDEIKTWANGTSISNAEGSTLDDYGYLFNVMRNRRSDAIYKAAILSAMASATDSGTASQVISLSRNIAVKTEDTLFSDIFTYPNTRFGVMRLEGGILTSELEDAINDSVSSGSRLLTTWDSDYTSFIPCVWVDTTPPEEILATLSGGTDPVGVRLGTGSVVDLGYAAEGVSIHYPATQERSYLTPSVTISTLVDSYGVPIELLGSYDDPYITLLLGGSVGGLTLAVLSSATTI